MPTIKIKDISLYYEEYGGGDVVLLCAQQFHAKGSSFTIDLADRGFHVYNITIRGYGQSTHVLEDYGDDWYDIWAQDVCDFAAAIGIEKFIYAGVSHGAGIGWTLCTNHHERLLAFLSVVGGPHSRDGQETGEARLATIRAAETPESWKAFTEKMNKHFRRVLRGNESAEELARLQAADQEFLQSFAAMTPEEARINPKKPFPRIKTETELIEVMSQIDVPTLMLGGMQDHISLPENLLRSCKAVKNSKLIIYQNATHGLEVEHRAELVEDILNFCRLQKLL